MCFIGFGAKPHHSLARYDIQFALWLSLHGCFGGIACGYFCRVPVDVYFPVWPDNLDYKETISVYFNHSLFHSSYLSFGHYVKRRGHGRGEQVILEECSDQVEE